jgi:hypothetical protein
VILRNLFLARMHLSVQSASNFTISTNRMTLERTLVDQQYSEPEKRSDCQESGSLKADAYEDNGE